MYTADSVLNGDSCSFTTGNTVSLLIPRTLLLRFQWSDSIWTWRTTEMAMDVLHCFAAFEHTQRNRQQREQSVWSTVRCIMYAATGRNEPAWKNAARTQSPKSLPANKYRRTAANQNVAFVSSTAATREISDKKAMCACENLHRKTWFLEHDFGGLNETLLRKSRWHDHILRNNNFMTRLRRQQPCDVIPWKWSCLDRNADAGGRGPTIQLFLAAATQNSQIRPLRSQLLSVCDPMMIYSYSLPILMSHGNDKGCCCIWAHTEKTTKKREHSVRSIISIFASEPILLDTSTAFSMTVTSYPPCSTWHFCWVSHEASACAPDESWKATDVAARNADAAASTYDPFLTTATQNSQIRPYTFAALICLRSNDDLFLLLAEPDEPWEW